MRGHNERCQPMVPGRGQWGLTLPELLAVLATVALLGGFAFEGGQQLLSRTHAASDLHRLTAAIQLARASAVTFGEPITICAQDAGGRCNGNWSGALSVFRDPRRAARMAAGDQLLQRFEPIHPDAALDFRAFGARRYLRLLPNGQTDWQNGRFEYCPPRSSEQGGSVLVINVQGRLRSLSADQLDPNARAGATRSVDCN